MHFKNHYDIGPSRKPVPTGLWEFVSKIISPHPPQAVPLPRWGRLRGLDAFGSSRTCRCDLIATSGGASPSPTENVGICFKDNSRKIADLTKRLSPRESWTRSGLRGGAVLKGSSRTSPLSVILSVVSRYRWRKANVERTDTESNPFSDP